MSDGSRVRLYSGGDAALVERVAAALRARGVAAAVEAAADGQHHLVVPSADVARAAPLLAELLASPLGPRPSAPLVPGPEVPPPAREQWAARALFVVSAALLAASATAPEASGGLGLAVVVWLLLGGKALRDLARPGANRPAIWSLLTLLGLFAGAAATPRARTLPALQPLLPVLPGLMVVLLALSAVLGTRGLLAGYRRRAPRLPGRDAAWSALVLGGLMAFGFLTAFLRTLGQGAEAGASAAPAVITEEELNFRFRTPGGAWRRMEAKKLNPAATVVLARSRPTEAYLMIIAERTSPMENEAVDEFWRSLHRDKVSVPLEPPVPTTLGGKPALRSRALEPMGALPMALVNTSMASRGFAYQLMCWTAAGAEDLVATCGTLAQGFELIDPERSATPPPRAPPAFRSAEEGVEVTLGAGWAPLDAQAKASRYPTASYAAGCGEAGTLVVTSFPLRGQRYPEAAVDQAVLRFFSGLQKGAARREAQLGGRPAREYVLDLPAATRTEQVTVRVASDGDRAVAVLQSLDPAASDCPPGLDQVRLLEAPRSPHLPERLHFFHRWVGEALQASRDVPGAIAAYRQALALDPYDYDAAWGLVGVARDLGAAAPVGQAFRELLARRGPADPMRAVWAGYLEAVGRPAEAAGVYPALFAAGLADDEVFAAWMHLLEKRGRAREALTRLAAYDRKHHSPRLVQLRAGLLTRAGNPRAGLKVLLDEVGRAPDRDLMVHLMWQLANLHRHAEVLSWAERATQAFGEQLEVLEVKATSELALDRYAAARRTAEQGLRLDGDHEHLERVHRAAVQALGQGNNEAIREPLEAVPLPASLPPVPEATPPPAETEYLLTARVVRFVPGQPYRETLYRRIRVADQAGLEALSTMSFSFEPRVEQVYLNALVVTGPDGGTLGRARAEDCYLADEATEELGVSRRKLHVPVPGLVQGATIDLTFTTSRLSPTTTFPYLEEGLHTARPTRLSVVAVDAPADRVKVVTAGEVTELPRAGTQRVFLARSLPPYASEPFAVPYHAAGPMLWAGEAAATWEAELAEYRREAGARLGPDPAMAALARQLTRDVPEGQRALVLARHVSRNILYKGLEFGRGARVPRSSAEVLKRKFGDCKDQSLLLRNLLQGAGLRAELALVRSSGRLEEGVASLDQFDHMVVHLPDGPLPFIDPTDRFRDPAESADWLAGQPALLAAAGPVRFVPIPRARAPEVDVEVDRELKLKGEDLEVREQVTLRGGFAAYVRRDLAGSNLHDGLVGWLGTRATVHSARADALEDPTRPLRLEVAYQAARLIRRVGGELVVTPPASWESQAISVRRAEPRRTPFQVQQPLVVRSTTRLVADPAHQVNPGEPVAGQGGPLAFSVAPFPVPGGEGRRFHFERGPASGPPAEFGAWWQGNEKVLAALVQPFVLAPARP